MTQLLEVSESALRRLQEVLTQTTGAAPVVRVSARLAGTGLPAYDITPLYGTHGSDGPDGPDGPLPGDTVLELDGLVVYVDPASAPLVAGVRLDHVVTPLAAGFLFRPSDAQLTERVKTALETVRPRLQADGGDVELVEVREATAVLAFQGSCVGCSMANQTLTRLLEQHLRQAVPELVAVTAETVRPSLASVPQ